MSFLRLRQQKGNNLQGFAQSHVIGQDAAEAAGCQGFQPQETPLLVAAKNPLQALRHLEVIVIHRLHVSNQSTEITAPLHRERILFPHLAVQVKRPKPRHLHHFLRQLLLCQTQPLLHFRQSRQFLSIHLNERTILQAMILLPAVIPAENLRQLLS